VFEGRVARAWRGSAAGGIATFAATVSHAAADGRPAPLLGVVLTLGFAIPVCVALAGRRSSWSRLSVAVALSQFVFHGLLSLGMGAGSSGQAPAPSFGAHVHTHADGAGLAIAQTPVGASGHETMWLAHAFAAVVTILAIGHGERMLRALLTRPLFAALRRIGWRPADVAGVRLPAPVGDLFSPIAVRLSCVVRRRGPPLAA